MADTPFPEAFSTSVIGLGTPIRYFQIKNMNRVGSLVGGIVFLLGAVSAFGVGIYNAYVSYSKHGLVVIGAQLSLPAIIAFILFLLGLVSLWAAYTNWNRGVGLYDLGFAVRSRKGMQLWRWVDISSIRVRITRHYTNGIYTGTTHEYMLVNKQNEKLSLNDVFVKVPELGDAIEQNLFPLMYEPAAQQYNDGQMLIFGPVVVSKTGIHIGKRDIPWEEVKEISLKQGQLRISPQKGGWLNQASIPAAAIPNLRVLLAIINQVVGLKTAS